MLHRALPGTVVSMLMLPLLGVLAAGRPVLAGPRAGQPAPSAPAPAAAVERLGPGVQIDWSRGVLSAAGSCAADLFAASAEVARVKAERLARLRAEDRLRKALAALVSNSDKDKARAERLARLLAPAAASELARLDVARASVARIEYAATGSVSLRLELPLRAGAAATSAPPAAPNPDAGATESESPGASE